MRTLVLPVGGLARVHVAGCLRRAGRLFQPEAGQRPSSKAAGEPGRGSPGKTEPRVGDSEASSLGLDENVAVLGVQHTLADELLGDGDGNVIGHTQVGQVVQEPGGGDSREGLRGGPLEGTQAPRLPSWQLQLPGACNLLLLLPSRAQSWGCGLSRERDNPRASPWG